MHVLDVFVSVSINRGENVCYCRVTGACILSVCFFGLSRFGCSSWWTAEKYVCSLMCTGI